MAVYAPALDAGIITPATVYEDSPLNEDRNWPQNDSRSYSGLCNVLRGLTRSLNTISVKVLNDLGVENSYQFLTQKLGFTTSWTSCRSATTPIRISPLLRSASASSRAASPCAR